MPRERTRSEVESRPALAHKERVNDADMAEPVDATDLKSVSFGSEGSSPSVRTNSNFFGLTRLQVFSLSSTNT